MQWRRRRRRSHPSGGVCPSIRTWLHFRGHVQIGQRVSRAVKIVCGSFLLIPPRIRGGLGPSTSSDTGEETSPAPKDGEGGRRDWAAGREKFYIVPASATPVAQKPAGRGAPRPRGPLMHRYSSHTCGALRADTIRFFHGTALSGDGATHPRQWRRDVHRLRTLRTITQVVADRDSPAQAAEKLRSGL